MTYQYLLTLSNNQTYHFLSLQQYPESSTNEYSIPNRFQSPVHTKHPDVPVYANQNSNRYNNQRKYSNVYSAHGNNMVWSSQWTEWLPMKMFNSKRHRDTQTKQRRKPISPISIGGNLTKEARDTYNQMAKEYSTLFEDIEYG